MLILSFFMDKERVADHNYCILFAHGRNEYCCFRMFYAGWFHSTNEDGSAV